MIWQELLKSSEHNITAFPMVSRFVAVVPEEDPDRGREPKASPSCDKCSFVRIADHCFESNCQSVCSAENCGYVRHELPHYFEDDCDATCSNSECGFVREAPHCYENECDTSCNECGFTRVPPHKFTNNEDYICDNPDCDYTI